MPELPEVETIRRQLLPLYRGEVIRQVEVKTPSLLQDCTAEDFAHTLKDTAVEDIRRFAKYLIFRCDGRYPVFHLGMSGIFISERSQSNYPQHIHVEFTFQSGKQLFYQDVRKLGKIWLYREEPQFPDLGIDPMSEAFTPERFAELIRSRNMNVKQFLMDQSMVAGLGNIYVSEALFEAGISPRRKTGQLTDDEVQALYQAIQAVLQSAIEHFGTTYTAYRTVTGESGENQNFLKVYQREGQPCPRCGTPIEKVSIGNRSTFFCPTCQI